MKSSHKNSKHSDRRRFLRDSAALAGVAFGGLRAASGRALPADIAPKDLHAYGERSHYEKSVRIGTMGYYKATPNGPGRDDLGLRTPHQDSMGNITPNPLHYVVSHIHEPPDIDPQKHRLLIHGMVDRSLVFTLDEIKRLPSVSRIHFVECNANGDPSRPQRRDAAATVQVTNGQTSCSLWTGVPLSLLLKEAGVKKSATWIIAEGAEESMHTKSIPLEKAMDDCLVVYGQNGEPIYPQQGFPLRLMVPGWEGINSVKWLRRIKLVDEPVMAMFESTRYPSLRRDGKARWFQFELGPKSVITYPSGGQKLSAQGFYEISGLAWSGGGVVRRVEVSTDGGRTWKDAEMQMPAPSKGYTRFVFPWNWNGEEAVLQSRSTDERGEVQPTMGELAKIWRVEPDYFKDPYAIVGHFNAIQPWKVTRDGSVYNALFS